MGRHRREVGLLWVLSVMPVDRIHGRFIVRRPSCDVTVAPTALRGRRAPAHPSRASSLACCHSPSPTSRHPSTVFSAAATLASLASALRPPLPRARSLPTACTPSLSTSACSRRPPNASPSTASLTLGPSAPSTRRPLAGPLLRVSCVVMVSLTAIAPLGSEMPRGC